MPAITQFLSPGFVVPGVQYGFFGRTGGVSSGYYSSLNVTAKRDSLENVLENQRRALQALDSSLDHLIMLEQVHGCQVHVVKNPEGAIVEADGLVTTLEGVALGIQTADCVPVLFSTRGGEVIGACHAGWKGAFAGIVENTVSAMEGLGGARGEIRAVVGPCIAQSSYEVGEDFFKIFYDQDSKNICFFLEGKKAGKFFFDIRGYVSSRLGLAGIGAVSHVDCDTFEQEGYFFSNRRRTLRAEPYFGGQLSAIAKRNV